MHHMNHRPPFAMTWLIVLACLVVSFPSRAEPFQWASATPQSQGMSAEQLERLRADLAGRSTTGLLVIEFIAPEDSMFRRLVRGREELHKDLTAELFEKLCARHFEIVRKQHVENTARTLYLLRKR